MTQELAVRQDELSISQVLDRVRKIKLLLEKVLHEGPDKDYGVIPGTGKKSLYKAGAEKILMMFQMSSSYEIEDLSTDLESRYRCTCTITGPDGQFMGSAKSECSSFEDKFGWRGVKGDNEWNATPEESRRTKWSQTDTPIRQVRYERAESAHKVCAMAQKRAMVLATRTATACSDIFTQDIDTDPQSEQQGERRPIDKPQAKTDTPKHEPAEGDITIITSITNVAKKPAKTGGGSVYWIESSVPDKYSTFSDTLGATAQAMLDKQATVALTYKVAGQYKNLVAIEEKSEAAE